jgi:hypothetical protein
LKTIVAILLMLAVSVNLSAQTIDHTDVVRAAKAAVIAAGVNVDADDCSRFKVTALAAAQLASEAAGLLSKPGGANCASFATDIIAYSSGAIVDVLGAGADGPNTPHWMVQGAVDPSRWRAVHPALTGLDHASMAAAVTASFRGLYGRDPSGLPGSGADDVNYWIAVTDHYGEFSDHICRAGWSRYWETKLGGTDSADPALGDQPARFQPGQPTPPPEPTPPPAPIPAVDLALVLNRLDVLERELADHAQKEESHWSNAKSAFYEAIKYLAPVIGGIVAGRTVIK